MKKSTRQNRSCEVYKRFSPHGCGSLKRSRSTVSEQARYTFNKGYCELTLFNVEQAIQLYTKFPLYRRLGGFPKTHYLRDLVKRLVDVYGNACKVDELYDKNLQAFAMLEYAYVSLRYLPFRVKREDCEIAMKLSEKPLRYFDFSRVYRDVEEAG